MGKICPDCGTDNTQDSEFCKKCGTQIIDFEDKPLSTQTIEAPREELTTGSTFAERYQIIEELGKGGMGKVYRAFDKKLNEEVALKLIKPEIASDNKTLERFQNELKLARKIRHSNVGGMYELLEDKGLHYITMEYVTGEDLKSFISRSGRLTVSKAINVAIQICEGLTEAHKVGVVHRDLKPSNIMIDKNGNARIMDFGIARALKEKGITGVGVIIGTPEYMSPEQVESKEIDQRSDIYSLGVILYEMVTGRVPFEGDTPFSIGMKHKGETPKNPKELNTQISDDLNRVILRCLEKDKEKRYQSAGEVRSELTNIEKGIPITERIIPERKPLTSKEITLTFGLRKLLIPCLVVLALGILAVIVWQLLPQKEVTPPSIDKLSIAVLPFEDASPQKDQEIFCDGMTDEIIAKLSRFQKWNVMNRNSVMLYKGTKKDIKEIGEELNVGIVLTGNVRKEEDIIRVMAQLVNVTDRFQIWSDTYNRKLEKIFEIQSAIAEQIATALMKELSPEEKNQLWKKPTENMEAYNLYLQGRFFWNKRTEEGLNKAIEFFEQAIEKDSKYAQAYAGLADCYLLMPSYGTSPLKEVLPKAKKAASKALEIDDMLAEAHTSLAAVMENEWDWEKAEREHKRAIELNPSYATAHHWYAFYLMWNASFDNAIEEIRRARELDPLSLIISADIGQILIWARRYDEAIESLRETLRMDPNFRSVHSLIGQAYFFKSMYEEALDEFNKEEELFGSAVGSDALIGITYIKMGMIEEAKQILNDLIEKSKEGHDVSYFIASLCFWLGENNQGFEWLNRAYEDQDPWLWYLKVDPSLDIVRSDSRFKDLLKKIGLG
ncbi:MAG: protein kinase [Candidatus Aminicenantes bacterium]|jgi:serine/threonine protein kinase/tetratricopeptide (TPR) repeat protein